jgi:hypothetical protein
LSEQQHIESIQKRDVDADVNRTQHQVLGDPENVISNLSRIESHKYGINMMQRHIYIVKAIPVIDYEEWATKAVHINLETHLSKLFGSEIACIGTLN